MESTHSQSAAPQLRLGKLQDFGGRVLEAIHRAQDYLFRIQHCDGYWCGELEADSTLESDYIMVHHLLGTGNQDKLRKAAITVLDSQLADGGWPIYEGGPSNVSATVKAYFALKLEGYSVDHPALVRARECITALGGVTEINTYTKLYLCFFGQYDYRAVPAIPPEMALFPTWFWFNLYEISSWSRAILVPLAIAYAKKPFRKIKPEQGIQELFPGGDMLKCNLHLKWAPQLVSWRNFFLVVNKFIHLCEMVHIRPLRSLALKRAEKWMLERMEMSDGLGAIYPGILNSIIALRCLGYSLDDPQVIRAVDEFEALGIDYPDHFEMQPCKSPVWDTVYAMYALGESGVPQDDPRLVKAADWVLKKQVTHKGDWSVKVPKVDPAGWYFEFNNEFYPDVDDSAQVLLALSRVEHSDESYQHKSVQRAIDWVLAMQCKSGGWASFDKDNTKMVFQYIPFADHNAMLDPPTVDITGRVLEMLATYGYTLDHSAVKKAIKFIREEQESDGSWFGRWGVNYIYGTMLVLRGLEAIGVDNHDPMIQQGAEWLRMCQNGDGGWGETVASYDDATLRGQGESTASQTAWAIMGLLAAGDLRSDCVARGVQWLLQHQNDQGTWDDDWFTGTGFPRVFYLRYHMYPEYFPLLALATYQKRAGTGDREQGTESAISGISKNKS